MSTQLEQMLAQLKKALPEGALAQANTATASTFDACESSQQLKEFLSKATNVSKSSEGSINEDPKIIVEHRKQLSNFLGAPFNNNGTAILSGVITSLQKESAHSPHSQSKSATSNETAKHSPPPAPFSPPPEPIIALCPKCAQDKAVAEKGNKDADKSAVDQTNSIVTDKNSNSSAVTKNNSVNTDKEPPGIGAKSNNSASSGKSDNSIAGKSNSPTADKNDASTANKTTSRAEDKNDTSVSGKGNSPTADKSDASTPGKTSIVSTDKTDGITAGKSNSVAADKTNSSEKNKNASTPAEKTGSSDFSNFSFSTSSPPPSAQNVPAQPVKQQAVEAPVDHAKADSKSSKHSNETQKQVAKSSIGAFFAAIIPGSKQNGANSSSPVADAEEAIAVAAAVQPIGNNDRNGSPGSATKTTASVAWFKHILAVESALRNGEAPFADSLLSLLFETSKSLAAEPNITARLQSLQCRVLLDRKQYSEAESKLIETITSLQGTPYAKHISLAYCWHALAQCYHQQNKTAEAEATLQTAIAVAEEALGPTDPETLYFKEPLQ